MPPLNKGHVKRGEVRNFKGKSFPTRGAVAHSYWLSGEAFKEADQNEDPAGA